MSSSTYSWSGNPKSIQFSSGIKFANVPGGKSTNVQQLNGSGQVFHVNTVIGAKMSTIDLFSNKSGVVQNRRRPNFTQVPVSVRHIEQQQTDAFGNFISPGVGL